MLTGFCRMASTFPGGRETCRVTRDDDDWNALFLQSINQAVGPLAVSQIDVNDGYVGSALGKQTLGVRYGGSRTGYIRSQYAKQTLHGIAELPGIFNQQDMRAFQFRRSGRIRLVTLDPVWDPGAMASVCEVVFIAAISAVGRQNANLRIRSAWRLFPDPLFFGLGRR